MITAAYIITFGLLWRFMRGITYSDFGAPKWIDIPTSKYGFALLATIGHYFLLGDSLIQAAALLVALCWAVAFGWGRGFLAIHGNQAMEKVNGQWLPIKDRTAGVHEGHKGWRIFKDIPAYWMVKLVYKCGDEADSTDPKQMRLYGWVWMTMDALFRFAPLVGVLTYFNSVSFSLLLVPLALAFGASYRAAAIFWPRGPYMSFVEILSGLWVGLVVAYV